MASKGSKESAHVETPADRETMEAEALASALSGRFLNIGSISLKRNSPKVDILGIQLRPQGAHQFPSLNLHLDPILEEIDALRLTPEDHALLIGGLHQNGILQNFDYYHSCFGRRWHANNNTVHVPGTEAFRDFNVLNAQK